MGGKVSQQEEYLLMGLRGSVPQLTSARAKREACQRRAVLEGGDGGDYQPFLSFFLPLSFLESMLGCASALACALGCSSGMSILLRWTVRLLGGLYLSLDFASSSKLILLGPFFFSVSYRTYWWSSTSSSRPKLSQDQNCGTATRIGGRTCFVSDALCFLDDV